MRVYPPVHWLTVVNYSTARGLIWGHIHGVSYCTDLSTKTMKINGLQMEGTETVVQVRWNYSTFAST